MAKTFQDSECIDFLKRGWQWDIHWWWSKWLGVQQLPQPALSCSSIFRAETYI